MSTRRVVVDQRGHFLAGLEVRGEILIRTLTTIPAKAMVATPEVQDQLKQWEERGRRYGNYDAHQVIDVELHAATC